MKGPPPLLQPGMHYTIWQPAGTYTVPGKGEFPEQFAPGAFDRCIGQEFPITMDGTVIGRGRLTGAEVAGDGSGVSLTYEVLEGLARP